MGEKVIQVIVLAFLALFVHFAYVFWIGPEASSLIEASRASGSPLPRNFFIIVKDIEQEVCIILFLWATYPCIEKLLSVSSQSYLFEVDLFDNVDQDLKDIESTLKALEELPEDVKGTLLAKIFSATLRRYAITSSVQDASEVIEPAINAMALKNDTEISFIKYIVWAIPSIGFLGTVRGIGQAMAEASAAVGGDIVPMTSSLGVAFNSTFVALMLSVVLMFLLSYLQRAQDEQLIKAQEYCERHLIKRISIVTQPQAQFQADPETRPA